MICRLFLLSLCYCKVPIIINLKLKNMKDLEDDEREFPIRVYTKVELALLYAPHLSENAALNNLSRWMRHNKLLMAALEEVGYYKYRHSFTPKEVRLIFRYMGEPGA